MGYISHGTSGNKDFSTKRSKNINVDIFDLTPLNNENGIIPNTGNFGRHCPLPHNNITGLIGYGSKKLYPEEVTSSPQHSNYQQQRRKEITTNNKNTSRSIVLDGNNFKFTGENNIESK